jgi:hypothetical protein
MAKVGVGGWGEAIFYEIAMSWIWRVESCMWPDRCELDMARVRAGYKIR